MRIVTLAAAACLLSGAPAWSQTPAPPAAAAAASEADQLGAEVIHVIFEAIDFDGLMQAEFSKNVEKGFGVKSRPEWAELLREAAVEEFAQDMPQIELMLGRKLAQSFNVGELRAGVAFLKSPGVSAGMFDASRAKDAPMPREVEKALDRLGKTDDGRGFIRKLGELDNIFDKDDDEIIALVVPGLLRRFGEKAEAAEAARRAAAQ